MIQRKGILAVSLVLLLSAATWAPDVTGNWDVTLKAADREAHGKATLTQKGSEVTGSLGPEGDPFPITGTVKGDKLVLETHPPEGRNVAFAKAELTIKGDKLTGTMDGDNGTIELVRSK